MAPSIILPCGQSIRRVHDSAVHYKWGGRREGNHPGDLAMGRKLYLCKGMGRTGAQDWKIKHFVGKVKTCDLQTGNCAEVEFTEHNAHKKVER
ncbi:hypothetical protein CDAR_212101 [Caerostris darwini]|uniref:Uncharacterized protein n=1 Tax=Caerostris darwini TaxID=1538125 RepID=A0AAV4NS03_9ARAC|nr:hypothetical protein CDAR_212101 [Caerostris darwini]